MNLSALNEIACRLATPGKGLLAADESARTIRKRFDAIGVESTDQNRRDYRELLFRTGEAMSNSISGVILYDETIWQEAADGTPLVELIKAAGSVPGIKVDKGTKPLPAFPGEAITEGLDDLSERLAAYYDRGARFAKWRAVIDVGDGIPTAGAVKANAHALARYASLCQANEIVPIVEPEVLMKGGHNIDRCDEITRFVLQTTFQGLFEQRVALEGIVLKPNMVISGKTSGRKDTVEEVAMRTLAALKAIVPAAVPGVAFLSGGQSDEEATAHLNAMNRMGPLPWTLTFSYGRALQTAAQKVWLGKKENVAAAQRAFAHRARMNSLASLGQWEASRERPSVPMTMRHQPPGSLPLRALGDPSKWTCPARLTVSPLQPLALKLRKAVGRRWFQRQRLRRLNFWTVHAAAHSPLRTNFAFSVRWTVQREPLARLARSCAARGSIRPR
jgi:fructose-bisphosphate aldolase class I